MFNKLLFLYVVLLFFGYLSSFFAFLIALIMQFKWLSIYIIKPRHSFLKSYDPFFIFILYILLK